MLWLGVSLWAIGMAVLVGQPRLFGIGVWVSLLLFSTLVMFLGGPQRSLAPLLLSALALGLFLPSSRPPRAPRVAPRRRAHALPRRFTGTLMLSRDLSSPLDPLDIPGYEVLEKVGSGGMASVFRARRKRGGATVALKLPAESFVADEGFIRRFHREAEVAQRLAHPNIVRSFEHGSVGAKHFMVMEFVDGYSLERYIDDDHRSDYATSCELMRQAVRALSYIHEAGIVHRDIKPANMMLERVGFSAKGVAADTLKLMDFGVAGGAQLSKLTAMGVRIGTPTYMSPEQARGRRSDERSDVYSLGLVFYELLTGQAAFRGGYEVIVHQQIFQLPPPPRQLEPRVPAQLERLVMQMIQKEPEARPTLAQVAYRLSEPLVVPVLEPESRLLCVLGAPRGMLRILDTGGQLPSIGDVGATLPAPPQACTGDGLGNLYVAVTEGEAGAHYPMIYKLGLEGEVLESFGSYGTRVGEFLRPVALALAPDGSLWVLDAETHRVEHFRDGHYLGGFGGSGGGEGRFNDPRDLHINAHGELSVLDYGNRQVQHFGADGTYKNRWAFRASKDAPGGAGNLRQLSGFTFSRDGDLYLREALSGHVHKLVAQGSTFDTLNLQADATGTDVLVDMGVDEVGNLFAAERGGCAIRKYAPNGDLLATLETYAPIVQLRIELRA